MDPSEMFGIVVALSVVAAGVGKAIVDFYRERENREQVQKAESEAFIEKPMELERTLRKLADSPGPEERTETIGRLIEDSRAAISMGRLFNLYSKQSEKYQQQTRSRATWSFIFAILAMSAGLLFVFWGGTLMLRGSQAVQLAAGGTISAVGGAVSAFIAKTFLDVHRLSLTQLNTYFRQPVINGHILMAQRLAEEIGDDASRKQAYELVIQSVTTLIKTAPSETPAGEAKGGH